MTRRFDKASLVRIYGGKQIYMSELTDANFIAFLGSQSAVEIHINDVKFATGGIFRVFHNGRGGGEDDNIHKAVIQAMNCIVRKRQNEAPSSMLRP